MADRPTSIALGVAVSLLLIVVLVLHGCGGPSNEPPTVSGGANSGIWGYVRDASGAPIQGALVACSDGETIYSATSKSDGYYIITGVPVGARAVSFDRDGYSSVHKPANVTSPTDLVQVDAVLNTASMPCPDDPPVITIDSVDVDEGACVATVSGEVHTVIAGTAVLVLNGSEQIIPLDAGYRFDAFVILNAGANVIVIRSSNCRGNTLSDPIPAQCNATFLFRVTLTWDVLTDIDIHIWGPGSGGGVQHCSYRDMTIDAGELDYDNTSGYGPENFTAHGAPVIPGRYAIGVNFYAGSPTSTCNIRVLVPGVSSADFGPHALTTANYNDGYPITVDTSSWWRPADVIVAADGSVSVVAPDTSISYPEYSTTSSAGTSSVLGPKSK
ncbi:MAG: carboxypeptidase regulatory-like domain-containing protein [Armatimonadota bacterium]|jgi:hypothetical protein